MIYALDTNILIDMLREKDPALFKRYLSHSPAEYAVSELVRAELYHGAEMSRNPKQNRSKVDALLEPLTLIPFGGDAVEFYGRIKADLQRRGICIGPNDLLIAASALAHQHCLVTRNSREFLRVPGLRLEEW